MHLNLRGKNGRLNGRVCLMKESIFEVNTMLILYISDKRVGFKNNLNLNLLDGIQACMKRTGELVRGVTFW